MKVNMSLKDKQTEIEDLLLLKFHCVDSDKMQWFSRPNNLGGSEGWTSDNQTNRYFVVIYNGKTQGEYGEWKTAIYKEVYREE